MMILSLITDCQKSVNNPAGAFAFGDTVEIKNFIFLVSHDNTIRIGMDSVLNDSRCPSGAACIWAGNASVRFLFQSNRNNSIIILNTFNNSVLKNDTIVNGFHIIMTSLTPYAAVGTSIKQKDYNAEILIVPE